MSGDGNHLPKSWASPRLKDIAQPTRPRESPKDFPALPFIGMENVEAHTMRLLGTVPASTMRSSAVHFYSSDVLYGRLRPYLNKVYRAEFEGLCSAEFITFPENEWLNSKYLQYFLNSSAFVSFASHLNAGDRPRVDFDQIGEYRLSLAPIREQERIVAEIEKQFTRMDAAVAALKRVQANLKRYRASVLNAACEGRLVPTEAELARREGRPYESASELLKRILAERRSRWEAAQLAKFRVSGKKSKDNAWKAKYKEPAVPEVNNLPNLPEGWTWATLSQLSWDAAYGTSDKCDYHWPGPPVLRIPNIVNGRIELNDLKRTKDETSADRMEPLATGDLLIIRTNGSRDLIGRSAVVREMLPVPHYYASYLIRYRLVPEMALISWVRATWDSTLFRSRIEALAATTAGQYNVSIGKLDSFVVPLPPETEMIRIAEEVDRRVSILEESEVQVRDDLNRSERLRQSILKRAFEGNLVPQDPNDEPASVLLERIRAERQKREEEQKTNRKRKSERKEVASV